MWDFGVKLTFEEVLFGNEALVVLAESRRSVQQEVGALVLIDTQQNLGVFKIAGVQHGFRSVGQNFPVHHWYE